MPAWNPVAIGSSVNFAFFGKSAIKQSARACRLLIESAGDSQGAANQIQVVLQTEADSDGEALFDGFARARDEACCSR